MEDKEKAKDVMNVQLNFNLPLLSTKRHCGRIHEEESWCGNKFQGPRDERIPFSWEQAPGKPKNVEKIEDGVFQTVETPRPRPPPCRWHCGVESDNLVAEEQLPKQEETMLCSDEDYAILDHTISCCGDNNMMEDGEEEPERDNFTDAMDVFSLSEAIDILERTRKVETMNCSNEYLRNRVLESRGITSPSFIINRFLPDASAIAASSALSLANAKNKQRGRIMSNHHPHPPCCSSKSKVCDIRAVTRPQDSPKGCGMENLLPWRSMKMKPKPKHKLCGIKSPVITQRPSQSHLPHSATKD